MHGNEWPLVFFTLLCQAAVGVFLFSEFLMEGAVRRMGWTEVLPLSIFIRMGLLVITLTAVGISFFHLGNPQNAFLTLGNLRSSWLSREILFLLIFLTCTAVLFAITLLSSPSSPFFRIFQVVGGLAGLLLIFAMSRLYMLPAVPTWNSMLTPQLFFSSTFLLGTAFTAALWALRLQTISPGLPPEIGESWIRRTSPLLAGLIVSFILISLLLTVIFLLRLQKFPPVFPATSSIFSFPGILLLIRIVFLLIAAGWTFFLFLRLRPAAAAIPHLSSWIIPLGLIIAAEVLGRFSFYAVFTRTGDL